MPVIKVCEVCGSPFTVKPYRAETARFCSDRCRLVGLWQQLRGRKYSGEWCTCRQCGARFWVQRHTLERVDRRQGRFCSKVCMDKSREALPGEDGETGRHWTARYKRWREAVVERDRGLCSACGDVVAKPHVHHKFAWAQFPALRYEVSNGVTMCKRCHVKHADGIG